MNGWCILRHVVPFCPYGHVHVSHSDLHNTISHQHLWKILLDKSQKSKQLCGRKSNNGCTGPCDKVILLQKELTFSLAATRSVPQLCKPVSMQHPDYLCFHINNVSTMDCGGGRVWEKWSGGGCTEPILCIYITTQCCYSLDKRPVDKHLFTTAILSGPILIFVIVSAHRAQSSLKLVTPVYFSVDTTEADEGKLEHFLTCLTTTWQIISTSYARAVLIFTSWRSITFPNTDQSVF